MKLSNYSLNYRDLIIQGSIDIFKFLAFCRELGLDGASIHLQNLQSTQTDYLKQIRRAYLDNGLSVSMVTVSTDFGQPQERHEEEFKKFRQALRAAELLGAPDPGFQDRLDPGRSAKCPRPVGAAVRRACEKAAQAGSVGLGDLIRRLVPNGRRSSVYQRSITPISLVLDTGQFADPKGRAANPANTRRQLHGEHSPTASLARCNNVSSTARDPRGGRHTLDKVFDMQGVHYSGFIDIVYEPRRIDGKPGRMCARHPRVVAFLRSGYRLHPPDSRRRRGSTRS